MILLLKSGKLKLKDLLITTQVGSYYIKLLYKNPTTGEMKAATSVIMTFPYPVHDVQLTAKSLDGTANLQQLEPQSVVYGQTGRHSVGEI